MPVRPRQQRRGRSGGDAPADCQPPGTAGRVLAFAWHAKRRGGASAAPSAGGSPRRGGRPPDGRSAAVPAGKCLLLCGQPIRHGAEPPADRNGAGAMRHDERARARPHAGSGHSLRAGRDHGRDSGLCRPCRPHGDVPSPQARPLSGVRAGFCRAGGRGLYRHSFGRGDFRRV